MSHTIKLFQEQVWDYYAKHGRDLPWRNSEADASFDPYKIMVSEIMLQQTQVSRVTRKYHEFLTVFPRLEDLAKAEFSEVLRMWNGLGYNRRAKYLLDTAKQITQLGYFPRDINQLVKLPGIGKNTAAAICVYAFNQPEVFIETNIRTVFIHHFFSEKNEVDDKEILPLIQDSLEQANPREWYWALMDYGSFLKASEGNLSRKSKHYVKQSAFEGSSRQLRAQVLRALLKSPQSAQIITKMFNDERLKSIIENLKKDGLIKEENKRLSLV